MTTDASLTDRDRMVSMIRTFAPAAFSAIEGGSDRLDTEPGGDVDNCIKQALDQYNADRPRRAPRPATGDLPVGDGSSQELALPATYVAGFSIADYLETPVGRVPRQRVVTSQWWVDEEAGKLVVMYPIKAAQTYWLGHTTPHTISGIASASSTTVPDPDFNPLAALAASLVCTALAGTYAQTTDAQFGADVVNFRSKGDEWASRARDLRKIYDQHVNPPPSKTAPAQGWASWAGAGSTDEPYVTQRVPLTGVA